MNYPEVLSRRAQHLPERASVDVATYIATLNHAAQLAWRIRWSQRREFPDAEAPRVRRLLDAFFELHRGRARLWLMGHRHRAAAQSNVRLLTARAKPWGSGER
jgi:hypothetical protein